MRRLDAKEIEARRAGIDRRRALALAALAALSAGLPAPALAQRAKPAVRPPGRGGSTGKGGGQPTPGGFLTKRQYELLEEISELIIPADAHSGGAKAARVAEYIAVKVASSIDPVERGSWQDDLDWLDELSGIRYGKRVIDLSPAQKQAFMQSISRNEAKPTKPEEFAFGTIKWEVAATYYTSKIGVLDDLKYEGNVFIDEFVGTEVAPAGAGKGKE